MVVIFMTGQVPEDLKYVVDYFNSYSDAESSSDGYYQRIFSEKLVGNGDTVYDIGVGSGNHLPELSKVVGKSGKVVGIDVHPKKIQKAKEIVNAFHFSNVNVSFGDGRNLSNTPMKYNEADDVLIFGVLQYLNKFNAGKVLDEAAKACKPSGKIILGTAAQEYFEESLKYHNADIVILKRVENGMLPLYPSTEVGTIFTKNKITEEFKSRGFSAEVFSYKNKDVFPDNIMVEPDYIRNLPSEHFVVAKHI